MILLDPIFIVAGLLSVATDIDAIARDIVLRLHAESIERRAKREQPRRWRRGQAATQREHAERVKECNDDSAIIARVRLLGWDPKRDASPAVVLQLLPERTRQRKPRKRERWMPTALRGVA